MSGQKRLLRRFLCINLSVLLGALGLSLLYIFVKSQGITLFDCVFLKTFGFACAGCGSTRAILALVRFRPFEAFLLSPGVCVCALLLLWYDAVALTALVRRRPSIEHLFPIKALLLVPCAFVLTFLVRTVLHFTLGIDFV